MTGWKAFIFDLNGTMIDDMNYHIDAWHKILNDLGAALSIERVKEECYGKNHELLERIFPSRFSEEEKNSMSFDKEKAYQLAFKPKLKLLEGLKEFIEQAHTSGIKMGIASAAIMYNIDFVLDGTEIRKYFDAIVSADDVAVSKPDPESFLKAAKDLDVLTSVSLVFEDTPKGVEAALNAGMKVVVITTLHKPSEFDKYPNVVKFANDFTELGELINQTAN